MCSVQRAARVTRTQRRRTRDSSRRTSRRTARGSRANVPRRSPRARSKRRDISTAARAHGMGNRDSHGGDPRLSMSARGAARVCMGARAPNDSASNARRASALRVTGARVREPRHTFALAARAVLLAPSVLLLPQPNARIMSALGKSKPIGRGVRGTSALWRAIAQAKRARSAECLAIVRNSNTYHVTRTDTAYPILACVCADGRVTLGECEHV